MEPADGRPGDVGFSEGLQGSALPQWSRPMVGNGAGR